jgi:proline dehydrogenase
MPEWSIGAGGRAVRRAARDGSARLLRAGFLWASQRQRLAQLAAHSALTRGTVRRFVAGETLAEALPVLGRLHGRGLATTVDVLGEAVTSVEAAAAAADRYLEVLEALADGGLDRNISVKLTQLGLDLDPAACRAQLLRILERAAALGAFVRVDMEDHRHTEATLALVRDAHATYPNVGVVLQAYLRRSAADVAELNRERIRVRLCKGAYDEPAEVAFPRKADVDEHYRRLAETLLREGDYPALATHDELLIAWVRGFIERERIDRSRFEFQMLYGVRRDLQERLATQGFTVRVYVPFGTEWYPYYMRRLAERPANVLFMARSVLREGRRPRASR